MEILVTNTEQIQPSDLDETLIRLYGRDENGGQQTVTVRGFRPYLYAPVSEVSGRVQKLLNEDSITEVDLDPDVVDESLRGGKSLAKIYTKYPQDVRDVREHFEDPYAADVPFTRRFRIDTGVRAVIEVPGNDVHYTEIEPVEGDSPGMNPGGNGGKTPLQNVEPRITTVDIEVDDRNGFPEDGNERILSIVAHDSYTDEYYAWIDLNGRTLEDSMPEVARTKEKPGVIDKLWFEDSEKKMLIKFSVWLGQTPDPDLITGWNVDGFDLPYLLARMENVGVNTARLSREGWSGMSNRGDPRIKGRTVYDLLTVYKKNQATELQSYTLDYVAKEELGEEKIRVEEGFFELYEKDPARLLEYNARDVALTVGVNDEADVIHFRDLLRRQVGVDFEDSYDNKDFIDMMARRRLREWGRAGPVRPRWGEAESSDFEGAHVFDPYEGLAENVVGLDLASLYPYTMAMINASPDTKVDGTLTGERDADGRLLAVSNGEEVPVHKSSNGTLFRADKEGLFPSLVDDGIKLKSRYKELRNEAETDEEYKFYSTQYLVAKTITNSLYGVIGWERFFLYDLEVAEAVTLTGQEVIKTTAEYTSRRDVEVLYGDTDSVYIKFPDALSKDDVLNSASLFSRELNEKIYPELAKDHGVPMEDNLWEIEVEAFMERYFQAGKKKRYAYLATWKDGAGHIEDPEPVIVGFEYKRSDSAQITSDVQEGVLEAILDGREEDVSEILYQAAQEITITDVDWEYIGIPGGLQQKIDSEKAGEDDYYAFSSKGNYPQDAHPRAVWNSNHILGTDFGYGDKPMRVYLRPRYYREVDREIDTIAYETREDLEPAIDRLRVDVSRMISTTIINPLDRITSAMGIDASAAVHGQHQTGLGAFA